MAQVRVPHGTIRLARIFPALSSDWSLDIHKLIRAGLRVLRGHVEICTDSYSVVISLNLEQTLHCRGLFFLFSSRVHVFV